MDLTKSFIVDMEDVPEVPRAVDRDLIRRAQGGDKDAIREIVHLHIKWIATVVAPLDNPYLSLEDRIVNGLLVFHEEAMRRPGDLSRLPLFRSNVVGPRIVRTIHEEIAHLAVEERLLVQSGLQPGSASADDRFGPYEHALSGEREEHFFKMLEGLDRRRQELLMRRFGLRDGEPQVWKDVGAERGISTQRARELVYDGLQSILIALGHARLLEGSIGALFREFDPLWTTHTIRERTASPSELEWRRNIKEILNEFGPSRGPQRVEKQEEPSLSGLEMRAQQLFGVSLDETRQLFGSDNGWLTALVRLFPEEFEEEETSEKIMTLVEAERQLLAEVSPRVARSKLDPDERERILELCEKIEHERGLRTVVSLVFEQLNEGYFRLFLQDEGRCLDAIQDALYRSNSQLATSALEHVHTIYERARGLSVPNITTVLYPHQRIDVLLLGRLRNTLLGSQPGVGKTLEVIALSEMLNLERILVVCPKIARHSVWESELLRHTRERPSYAVLPSVSKDARRVVESWKGGGPRYVFVGHAIAAKIADTLNQWRPELIVVDESHHINNPGSLRSSGIRRMSAPRKILISASLFRNHRSELWAGLSWLYPDRFGVKPVFDRLYCRNRIGLLKLAGEIKPFTIRRHKRDVLTELPPRVEHPPILITLADDAQDEYDRLEEEFLTWWMERMVETGLQKRTALVMSKLHALRRFCIGAKYREIDSLVSECLAADRKMLLFCEYREHAKRFAETYRVEGVCFIDGTLTDDERITQVVQFQTSAEKRIFVTTAVGGESITLTAATVVIFAHKLWSPAANEQIADRAHRIGQTRPVDIHTMVVSGTIEESIERLLVKKRQEFSETIDPVMEYLQDEEKGVDIEDIIKELLPGS